jgi:Rrf2 family cysteine metabolism transcriptional repressor
LTGASQRTKVPHSWKKGEETPSFEPSLRSRYAIKAVVCLALGSGSRPVRAQEIADFGGIPPKFVEQVMHDLRQARIVTSRRGRMGGYALARDPDEISFADVVAAVEGRLVVGGTEENEVDAIIRPVWDRVRQEVWDILCTMSVGEAADRAATSPMYYI